MRKRYILTYLLHEIRASNGWKEQMQRQICSTGTQEIYIFKCVL